MEGGKGSLGNDQGKGLSSYGMYRELQSDGRDRGDEAEVFSSRTRTKAMSKVGG